MEEKWYLNPGVEKRTINESGFLSDSQDFICMDEKQAFAEARKRAIKYLKNGNPKPHGNRFYLTSFSGRKAICFHDV